MLRLWSLLLLVLIVPETFGQTCTLTVVGNINWSAGSWSCSGASPPTTDGSTFTGDIFVTGLGTGESVTMDIDLNIDGNLNMSVSGSNPAFTIPSGRTLYVSGDMGSSSVNNLDLTVDGKLNVGGTLELKNNNAIQGGGTINSTSIVVKNGTTCGTGCPTVNTGSCTSGNSWCSGPTINITGTPLPVELVAYDLTLQDQGILISWTTASEINNDFFQLERKQESTDWIVLAQLDGSSNSNELRDYHYLDVGVNLENTVYYRLTQVDFDGTKTTYPVLVHQGVAIKSETVEVSFISGMVQVGINREVQGLELTLLDIHGKEYRRLNFPSLIQGELIPVGSDDLPTGLYCIRLSYQEGDGSSRSQVFKVFVQ